MPASRLPFVVYLALSAPFLVNGVVYARIADVSAAYWAVELSIWVLLPLAGFRLLWVRAGITAPELGITLSIRGHRRPLLLLALSAAMCAVDWYGYAGCGEYFSSVLPDEGLFQYDTVMPTSTAGRLLMALYLAVTAGVLEEALHRGLGYAALTRLGLGPAAYLAATPVLFALIHWESGLANVAAAYVIGLGAALIFLWVRNLVPLVVGHVFTDLAWFGW